jgi:hypothetical protein
MIDKDKQGLFFEGDPFDGPPLWQRAADMVDAPPRPTKGYGVYSLPWLGRVLPILRAGDRVAVALLLYRQCLIRRSKTVDLPNGELAKLDSGRNTKYRTLALLREAGAITIEARNGQSVRVTVHWFP